MVRFAHTYLAIVALSVSCGLGALANASERISVYRCAAVNGAISLQDHPCPASSEQTLRVLARPPLGRPAAPLEDVPAATDLSADAPHSVQATDRAPAPPPLWVCRDYDGTERESNDGVGRGRYVPLWVVGRDPDAPVQLFGRVGAPLPQPSLRPPGGPRTVYSDAGSVTAQVYVEERCYLLAPGEACERYAERRRKLERRIFNSQPSERDRLRPELESLRRILIDACQR
jgi:hypothetical protein